MAELLNFYSFTDAITAEEVSGLFSTSPDNTLTDSQGLLNYRI
jgi:hypothetical protein